MTHGTDKKQWSQALYNKKREELAKADGSWCYECKYEHMRPVEGTSRLHNPCLCCNLVFPYFVNSLPDRLAATGNWQLAPGRTETRKFGKESLNASQSALGHFAVYSVQCAVFSV